MADRFLLDENFPASVAALLNKKGFETRSVRNIFGPGSSNGKIAEESARSGEIVITLDSDFLKLHPNPRAKVLHVDVHPAIPTTIIQVLETHLAQCLKLLSSTSRVRLTYRGPETGA